MFATSVDVDALMFSIIVAVKSYSPICVLGDLSLRLIGSQQQKAPGSAEFVCSLVPPTREFVELKWTINGRPVEGSLRGIRYLRFSWRSRSPVKSDCVFVVFVLIFMPCPAHVMSFVIPLSFVLVSKGGMHKRLFSVTVTSD